MKEPFEPKEIRKAISKLKNGKSSGCDEIRSKQLKYGPPEIIENTICEILIHAAETGEYPEEIKYGILTPFQKPNKEQGPCSTNLRPIFLLSMLRKIFPVKLHIENSIHQNSTTSRSYSWT